jgi:hypothetical protein
VFITGKKKASRWSGKGKVVFVPKLSTRRNEYGEVWE